MPTKIIQVSLIVDIVDLDFVHLALLKVVLHVKALDPCRIQIVHDDLSDAKFLPLRSLLAVEGQHAIGSCESIQVGQVFTGKAEADGLDEATGGRVDGLVDCGKDGLIEVTTDARATHRLHAALVLMCAHAAASVAY